MRANHSKDCGKGLARLEMMFISKLNRCKAELKDSPDGKRELISSLTFPCRR